MTRVSEPLFVCQVPRVGQVGPLAPWITMASWAGAAGRRHGSASVVTVEGVLSPAEALDRATTSRSPVGTPRPSSEPGTPGSSGGSSVRRRVPEPVITLAKDLRRVAQNRAFTRALPMGRWAPGSVPYVFGLHGLLWDGGLRLARRLGAPSVLVVDAGQVEEAASWGVRRPGWSSLAERFGERPQLRRADVVVCVTDEVAGSVERIAGRTEGVIVVANGVDTERFSPAPADAALRTELGLDGAYVVGWAGSFRSFHGLEALVDAAASARHAIPNLTLLLAGDGRGRPAVEERARALGVPAVFPGTVPYARMPEMIRLMDVATVLAPPGEVFHYSPVKLREYQACARPVVAAAAGEMGREAEGTVRLVPPGDSRALGDAITALHRAPDVADALGRAGRAAVVRDASWDRRLDLVEAEMERRRG